MACNRCESTTTVYNPTWCGYCADCSRRIFAEWEANKANREIMRILAARILEGAAKVTDHERGHDHYLMTNFHETEVCSLEDIERLCRFITENHLTAQSE